MFYNKETPVLRVLFWERYSEEKATWELRVKNL